MTRAKSVSAQPLTLSMKEQKAVITVLRTSSSSGEIGVDYETVTGPRQQGIIEVPQGL